MCIRDRKTPCPEDVIYVASVPELEALPVFDELVERTYGEMPVQIGYCNGKNKLLNALEYHRSSEIDVAVSDLVLMLGKRADITEDFQYDSANVDVYKRQGFMSFRISPGILAGKRC